MKNPKALVDKDPGTAATLLLMLFFLIFALWSGGALALRTYAAPENDLPSAEGAETADDIKFSADSDDAAGQEPAEVRVSPEPTPEVTPAPTPEPAPVSLEVDGITVSFAEEHLNWSGHDIDALIAAAPQLAALKIITLGRTDADWQTIDALQAAYPEAELRYAVCLAGHWYPRTMKRVDLSAMDPSLIPEAVLLLRHLPELEEVILTAEDGSSTFDFEDYKALLAEVPEVRIHYGFELFNRTVWTDKESLKYRKESIGDDGVEQLRAVLPWLPRLRYLSLDRCDIENETMEQLRDDFPEVKIVWRVWFGGFNCMTDAEKIWAIGSLYDEDAEVLKYCTDVKYIDVGHNALTNCDFLAYMPKVEVVILAINPLRDISGIANCTELEYLEIGQSTISDISPLRNCTKLKHLEASESQITDISPVMNIDMERFHLMYSYGAVPQGQFDLYQLLHPNCSCDFSNRTGWDCYFCSDWRYTDGGSVYAERYALLREQIGYDDPYGPTKLYLWEDDIPLD